MIRNKILKTRIQNYSSIKGSLKLIKKDSKCSLNSFKAYKRIGSASTVGAVFKLTSFKNEDLAVKVMHKHFAYEYEYYQKFKQDVLNGYTPHFPLAFEGTDCNGKCSFIKVDEILDKYDLKNEYRVNMWKDIQQNSCFLLFNELYDGDVIDFMSKHHTIKGLTSLLVQCLMGLYVLDYYQLGHCDFHVGNVLYQKIGDTNTKDKYFKYIVDDKTSFYVSHQNALFIIWDLEKSEKKGDPTPHSSKWLKTHKFDTTLKPVSSIYWDMAMLCHFVRKYYLFLNKTSSQSDSFVTFLKELEEMFLTYMKRFSRDVKVPDTKALLHKMKNVKYMNKILFENIEVPKSEISAEFDYRHYDQENCIRILEKEGIDVANIKKDWRQWMRQNHPDKFNHLSESVIKKQTKRFVSVKNCVDQYKTD